MRKILMKDIESGSENVKKLFRKTLAGRMSTEFLQEMKFTNDEFLEIFKLTTLEDNQPHRQRQFYSFLMRSQPGPFSDEVFAVFLYQLRDSFGNTMDTLMTKGGEISEENKKTWLSGLVQRNRYVPSKPAEHGIDVTEYPYNVVAASGLILNFQFGHGLKRVFDLLDTMTEDQMVETFKKSISSSHNFEVFTQYPKSTTKIIDLVFNDWKHFGEKALDKMLILVELPQASDDIMSHIYLLTKDDKYMPEVIQNIFVF